MKISRIQATHIAIPLKKSFETSFGVIAERPAIIVRMIATDGTEGYGESSPLYVPMSEPEVLAESMAILKKVLPKLIGLPVEHGFDISAQYPFREHPVSTIGIETAYLDLLSRSARQSLAATFGGTRPEVRLGESVGLKNSIDAVIQEIQGYLNEGISRIKIKIAPGKDHAVLQAVRHTFPDIVLGADANAAYTHADIETLSAFTQYNLSFIEQPFGADDLESHALLAKRGLPVCLDESIRDMATLEQALRMGACAMVNIKPARIGSFAEAKKIHDRCVKEGIPLFGGGRLETGLGKTTNAAFYSLPGFTEPSDITPPLEYFNEDIITPPFAAARGVYTLPQALGTGIAINAETIARYRKESFETN
jgi:O-succinylbenzoate synthase